MGAGASAAGGLAEVPPPPPPSGPLLGPLDPDPVPRRNGYDLRPGDHIAIESGLLGIKRCFTHHGIYVGDGTVIHFSNVSDPACYPANNGWQLARVKVAPLVDAAAGFAPPDRRADITVVGYSSPSCPATAGGEPVEDPPQQTVQRAQALVGAGSYNLVWRNCEHFAVYCKTGKGKSLQVIHPLA
eukprot:SAG22_NODE_1431_length_4441_cov_1.510134_5_plen_184_part_01